MSKERIKQLVEYVNAPEKAYSSKTIKGIIKLLNRVSRRNVSVENTDSITITKHNDWISESDDSCEYHDVTKLKADVNVSNYNQSTNFDGESVNLTNAIKSYKTGLYVADYKPILDNLASKLNSNITNNETKFTQVNGKIEKNKNDISAINTEITTVKDDILNANDNIHDNITEINALKNRLDNSYTLSRQVILPSYRNIPLNIVNDSLTKPPVVASVDEDEDEIPLLENPVLQYTSYQVNEKSNVTRNYEFFKLNLSGFTFNNVTSGTKILSIPISQLKNKVSDNFINNAKNKQYLLFDGYNESNYQTIKFKIVSTATSTDYTKESTLDVYVYTFPNHTLTTSVIESSVPHHVINIY